MNVIMLAAEFGGAAALRCTPLANTVYQLARALCAAGANVTVVTPGYGVVEGRQHSAIAVDFAGTRETVIPITVAASEAITHVALDHPRFSPQGSGRIYCQDGADAPYATDASKFAFFSAASASWVSAQTDLPDVVHVHDWPAALFFALREYDPAHLALRTVRSVFSLHSSEVQGRRPLAFHESSLRSWFADLALPRRAVVDPDYDDCVNPVATALRLADAVALPSASYVEDLCADDHANLAPLARYLHDAGRLLGIDAGAQPRQRPVRRTAWSSVCRDLQAHLRVLIGRQPLMASAHFLCDKALDALPARRPPVVASVLGPFDDNNLALLQQQHPKAPSVLDALLNTLGGSERLIAQGEGTPAAQSFLTCVAARQPRFIYLQGADALADERLLRATDLHLVLPRVAPGGAAALTALNAGRPCLVHSTGALADIVDHGVNGWHTDSAPHSIETAFAEACATKRAGGSAYTNMCQRAAQSGTPWADVAQRHLQEFYRATVI